MIPVMNIKRQYDSIKEESDKQVLSVLHKGMYINGENVKKFEQEFADYLGCKFTVGVGNGTDALVIALRAIGIKQGDEVITSALSFFATAEAIASVGAIPVFVDCTKNTYLIDPKKIEEKINEKTKAIIPVHLYGQCCDMDEINKIAKKYKLYVIEDCAQAAGATYKGKKAGNLSDIGCYSFFPTKNLGCCGDGGAITTNNEELYRICKALKVHGSGEDGEFAYHLFNQNNTFEKTDFGDNLPKYYNYLIGYNSRLDEIQASILRIKLNHLDEWNQRRQEIAKQYGKVKNNFLEHPYVSNENKHVYYVYQIKTKYREALISYLENNEISTGKYFPVPLHLQKVFEELEYKKGDMPNAEMASENLLAIPMFPELKEEEISKIINALNGFTI